MRLRSTFNNNDNTDKNIKYDQWSVWFKSKSIKSEYRLHNKNIMKENIYFFQIIIEK